MNLVDSSGWLEYFAGGKNAEVFEKPLKNPASLVVPTIIIFEVFKRILQQRNENSALQAISVMHQGKVADLDSALSLSAAKLSLQHRIPMADSIILATALKFNATLWTQDADFEKIPGVKFVRKI